MRPKQAAQLLTQMDSALRREVVGHMSRVVQLKEEDVRSVEYDVKNRIEFMMGGEDKLAEIMPLFKGKLSHTNNEVSEVPPVP